MSSADLQWFTSTQQIQVSINGYKNFCMKNCNTVKKLHYFKQTFFPQETCSLSACQQRQDFILVHCVLATIKRKLILNMFLMESLSPEPTQSQ